ncbi:hypothetical protein [Prolixibacter denitrificans]|uniref:Uncharacterized protein n=1 Tax=Prolixibacter denitrificans TaxID=1541063 RepID=A0A2P8CCE2_9BACT|nr:hypothetical protein [Prolixibacter denitrificans]PSK82643.1 hypothetical protein CLV93_10535 [Prolixibacter denitrificans]GET21534.1 hypothetical protein JCM18694_17800 [Prolixibacter denitrificans]
MPIKIYRQKTNEEIAWICNGVWDLPNQIIELGKWLESETKLLQKDEYVIDIGFDIQPNSTGGGAVIDSKLMKMMADKGFDLYLSEYPNQLKD